MTCIAAVVENGQVWVGGDSAGVTSGHDLTVRADKKVFEVGPYVIGFTTSFRMGQVLKHGWEPPVPDEAEEQKIEEFIVTKFVESVRARFKETGYLRAYSEGGDQGGTFLVGYKDILFGIEDDFQAMLFTDGYYAVGCGGDYAKGALHALLKGNRMYLSGDFVVKKALEAAENHSGGVRGPFTVKRTVKHGSS